MKQLRCPELIHRMKQPEKKIRRQVKWNTGERVHKVKKGKGSYDRKRGPKK